MKAVIVNCSDTFEYRVDMIYDCLVDMGWDVEVLASDYMHIEKKKRKIDKTNYIAIDTVPYKKNISLTRLYSHYDFAKKAKKILKNKSFDLLYLVIPANSIATIAKEYRNNDKVKVIIDIIDLWPESMPIGGTDKFPFTLWANVRNKNLKYADYIITECNLYREKLKKQLEGMKVETIYWCHRENQREYVPSTTVSDELTLCYLGSVNNIIDIPKIGEIVGQLVKEQPVTVKLIAAGEKKQELIDTLKDMGATVIDYGKVYDYDKKKEIIDTCHYGINIMKPTVNVGISMKSVDYLEMGLPVINNLRADLAELTDKYQGGINVGMKIDSDFCISYVDNMRDNARIIFDKYLCEEVFDGQLENVIESLYV